MKKRFISGPDPEKLLQGGGGGGTESRSHEPSGERGESIRGGLNMRGGFNPPLNRFYFKSMYLRTHFKTF